MPSIIDTLEQEVMWYAQDGLPVPLVSMDPPHMLNLYRYLIRNADRLYHHKLWKDMKELGVELFREVFEKQLPQDAEQWIRSTPFFMALRRRIVNHGSIDPDLLEIEGEPHGQGSDAPAVGRRVFQLGPGSSPADT